ncbi:MULTISPECIES: ABC-2 family transporter protein [unclassified Xenorhabdus]|uniref:ABC-2 family transporter protein n=1 Tax=unclassified Xenorhabdus TaxID=2632833 RepID=UPI000C052265|nr:ABC-2 family transporter protein [Xenorhabdus sp. KK7.4]MCC8382014.1 ABC-2 family transporter protein [Xenorhabdus sp. PB30.3]PHM58862.1 ABC transporter permease [Xenorhabdus sp. KK7.4]
MIAKFSFIETIRAKNIILGYYFLIITLYAVELSFWSTMTSSSDFAHYTRNEIITYILWSVMIFQLTSISGFPERLAFNIEDGSVDRLIIMPKSILLYYSEYAFGQMLARMFVMSPLVIFIIWYQGNLPNLLWLLVALCIGLFINLYLTMILSCMAFKFRGAYSFIMVKDTLSWALSGAVIPLDVFNDTIKMFFNYIPFQYITYVPVKIATNSISLYFILSGLLVMFFLMITFSVIWRYMIKYNQGYNGNA